MCGLCGLLGGDAHWAEGAGWTAETRRAERLRRVGLINAALGHYGLAVADWQGARYLLSSRTGRTEIVADLAELWRMAERMLGRGCDPLDPALVARLEKAA
jgi:hypothetical protein